LLTAHVLLALVGFLWYRLGHESRLLWLLAHRPHHGLTTLGSVTVFEAAPRFLLGSFWRYLMFGFVEEAITKLVSGDFYFIEVVMTGFLGGTLNDSYSYSYISILRVGQK